MSGIRIFLFGEPRIDISGRSLLSFPTQKSKSLFSFLAVNAGQVFCREALVNVVWPDADARIGRKALRQELWRLRSSILGDDTCFPAFRLGKDHIGIAPDDQVWVDVEEFRAGVRQLNTRKPLEVREGDESAAMQASSLYTAPFLNGVYDEWCLQTRAKLEDDYLSLLTSLATYFHARREWSAAIDLGRRVLEIDPTREDIHRLLMRCYYHGGSRTTAIRQFQRLHRALNEELGVNPAAETARLYARIRADERERPLPDGWDHAKIAGALACLEEAEREASRAQSKLRRAIEQLRTLHQEKLSVGESS